MDEAPGSTCEQRGGGCPLLTFNVNDGPHISPSATEFLNSPALSITTKQKVQNRFSKQEVRGEYSSPIIGTKCQRFFPLFRLHREIT